MAKIKYRTNQGLTIDIQMPEQFVFLGGDSGTGKTYLINNLENIITNPEILLEKNVNPNNIVLIDKQINLDRLRYIQKGSYVFVDRYDNFSNSAKKKIIEKMREISAYWIIMTRNPDIPKGLGATGRSFCGIDIVKDKDNKIFVSLKKHVF